MNRTEALDLLERELVHYRERSYSDLRSLIGSPVVRDVGGASGSLYYIQVEAFWDSRPGGILRVMGTIHDGGWRAVKPLASDFLVDPD